MTTENEEKKKLTTFEINRNALLIYLGVLSDQIKEEHVQIESLVFIDAAGNRKEIAGDNGNMFGRFFVQFMVQLICPDHKPMALEMTRERHALTAAIFADQWEDRHVAGKNGWQLLIALGNAVRIDAINWKKA